MKCDICPRECHADREHGQLGACGVSDKIFVARVGLHMWEEPCVSGSRGSGTVFFVGCPLGCIYCQNYKISSGHRNTDLPSAVNKLAYGREYSVEELADAFLKLQEMGANNVNLVTPTQYSYQIIDAVRLARWKGLILPIVYNCSGYEKLETLKKLEGTVDVYLTDFKYSDVALAKEYSRAADYPEIAKAALTEMVRQQPKCTFNDEARETGAEVMAQEGLKGIESGIMTKGVIVRNLLLPGHVRNSKDVIKYAYETFGDRIYISIMNQYTPLSQVGDIIPLNRKVTKREYERLVDYIISLGVTNAFIQEGDVAKESFIPEFS